MSTGGVIGSGQKIGSALHVWSSITAYSGKYAGWIRLEGTEDNTFRLLQNATVVPEVWGKSAEGDCICQAAGDEFFDGKKSRVTVRYTFNQKNFGRNSIAWIIQNYNDQDKEGSPTGPVVFGSVKSGDSFDMLPVQLNGQIWVKMPTDGTPIEKGTTEQILHKMNESLLRADF